MKSWPLFKMISGGTCRKLIKHEFLVRVFVVEKRFYDLSVFGGSTKRVCPVSVTADFFGESEI